MIFFANKKRKKICYPLFKEIQRKIESIIISRSLFAYIKNYRINNSVINKIE